MNNEASFKRAIKESVKYQKGYAISLAAPMMPGIPDLYVIMPGYMPILLEAKWLGDIKKDTFHRTLKLTSMQMDYIASCNGVAKKSAFIIVGFKWKGDTWAVMNQRSTIDSDFPMHDAYTCWRKRELDNKLHFDVNYLFQKSGIYRRNGLQNPFKDDRLFSGTNALNLPVET